VGLLATSLGLDSIISMNLNRPNANDVIVASTRKIGFFIGTDQLDSLIVPETISKWPVLCTESLNCDREEMQLEDENLYSRMCECSLENGEVTMTALYSEALWWVTIAVIILACLSGLYASVFAGFNAVAKPTKEYMSVRAVAYAYIIAITLAIIGMILTVVIYFLYFNFEEENGSTCKLLENSETNYPPEIPSVGEQYTCEDASLELGFYFQVIGIVLWIFGITSGYMSQRGFKSIDANSKFETADKNDDKFESMMF